MPTPGPLELVIILVIALLVLGPGKLPDVGAALGKSIKEFRKASTDIQESVKVDTTPMPTAAPPTQTAVPAPTEAPVAEAPAPEPAVAATSGDLPGTATVASTPSSTEPTPGTN